MGAALFKSLFQNENPKVALLNVGLEENKGNEILKKSFAIMKKDNIKNFDFVGYIEGNHIMDGNVDVIITDGFTGNIALKTAEGTANFITNNLKKSLNKLSILFSIRGLNKFKKKLDPRKYNGAIFLGLESPVVKSHGATDSTGFAYSIATCNKIVKANLIQKIKAQLINIDD
jgi:glycerol-3-phosphate acyltransferase PlsX